MSAVPGCPAVAPGGRGSTGPGGFSFLADGGGDLAGPRPWCGKPQPEPPATAGEPPGDGEDARPEPFRFPAAGIPSQGEHLGPGVGRP